MMAKLNINSKKKYVNKVDHSFNTYPIPASYVKEIARREDYINSLDTEWEKELSRIVFKKLDKKSLDEIDRILMEGD